MKLKKYPKYKFNFLCLLKGHDYGIIRVSNFRNYKVGGTACKRCLKIKK